MIAAVRPGRLSKSNGLRAGRSALVATTGAITGPVRYPGPAHGPFPRRVLCADRDAAESATLAAALRRCGLDARGCADGSAALMAVTEFRPHACVFDLDTAGIGGCELARWVRSVLGDVAFLIGSAHPIGDDLDRVAAAAGFDLLLARPTDAELVAGLLAGPTTS